MLCLQLVRELSTSDPLNYSLHRSRYFWEILPAFQHPFLRQSNEMPQSLCQNFDLWNFYLFPLLLSRHYPIKQNPERESIENKRRRRINSQTWQQYLCWNIKRRQANNLHVGIHLVHDKIGIPARATSLVE